MKKRIYLGIYVSTLFYYLPSWDLLYEGGDLGPETMEDIEPGGEEGAGQGIE